MKSYGGGVYDLKNNLKFIGNSPEAIKALEFNAGIDLWASNPSHPSQQQALGEL